MLAPQSPSLGILNLMSCNTSLIIMSTAKNHFIPQCIVHSHVTTYTDRASAL